MNNGLAYKLTFPNGKTYIGITRESLVQRIRRHIAYARANRQYLLSKAIRKYGETSFKQEILGYGSWDEIKAIEIAEIFKTQSFGISGYNMTGGGEGNLSVVLNAEIKAKISSSLTGRELTYLHKTRIGIAHAGKKISLETKEKMKAAALDRCKTPMSEDQREKRRIALLGKKRGPYKKHAIEQARKIPALATN